MHRIITGATGLIGTQLVNHWLAQGHTISVIGRSAAKIQEAFQQRVNAIEWQDLQPASFANTDIVVNLTGAGIAEKRWSESRKQEILHSRVDTTTKIANILASMGATAPALFNASAIGVYGLQKQNPQSLPAKLDENTKLDFEHAADFLSEIGHAWEKATLPASNAGVRVVNLRFGVVLAKSGGALKQMIVPYYFFMGGPIGTGQQAFCWVALDDVIRAIDFIAENKQLSGPVNIVAPECVTQRDLATAIGHSINRPAFMPMPAFVMKILLGEMASELLLEGQNIYPAKLLDAGFKFSYPDINSALKNILK
jgi:uncharacterized protein (TIGR01777 family)